VTDEVPNRIVIGGDEELPDPVDLADVPASQPRPTMDPRVRGRRIEVRRRIGRRRLVVILVALGVVLVVGALLAVLASPLFSVKDIQVSGAAYSELFGEGQLEAIVEGVRGDPILTIDTNEIRRQIEALPWVRRAEVATDFPRTLRVVIDERTPAASYLGGDGRWRVIDREGRVLHIEAGQPVDFLPVDGFGPDIEPGQDAGAAYMAAAELAETIADLPELQAIVARLSLGPGGELGMTFGTDDETVVNLGAASDLRAKLGVLITLLRQGELDGASTVDLSDPTQPAVAVG
jgi:cell division protein FtsQ